MTGLAPPMRRGLGRDLLEELAMGSGTKIVRQIASWQAIQTSEPT